MKKTSYTSMGNKYSNNHLSEEELNKKLGKTLGAIVGIIVFFVALFTFFAPAVGSFFGLFSIHKGEEDPLTKVKPNPPIFSYLPNATKDEQISVNGYAQPGLTVKLFVNGPEKAQTAVGADGLFSFNGIQLNTGTNTIFAKIIDAYGNESENSSMYQVVVDKEKPDLDITSPKKGEVVKNLDQRIVVTGKINEKGTVMINGKMAIVKPDLVFEFLLGVNEGNVKITVEATDEAGNTKQEEINVVYQNESN